MNLSQWTDKILWALITGVSAYGVNELKEIGNSLNALNIKMAVVVERVQQHSSEINDIKATIQGSRTGPMFIKPVKPLFEEEQK